MQNNNTLIYESLAKLIEAHLCANYNWDIDAHSDWRGVHCSKNYESAVGEKLAYTYLYDYGDCEPDEDAVSHWLNWALNLVIGHINQLNINSSAFRSNLKSERSSASINSPAF